MEYDLDLSGGEAKGVFKIGVGRWPGRNGLIRSVCSSLKSKVSSRKTLDCVRGYMPKKIKRIRSGGQTGVDRAALDFLVRKHRIDMWLVVFPRSLGRGSFFPTGASCVS